MFSTTNPLLVFTSSTKLYEAKAIVDAYKKKEEPAGVTEEQIWQAKTLVDSAFHPDTGELNNAVGRMSFQVWGNMTITGIMLAFNTDFRMVILSQWLNQSFNAFANYTNRNASSTLSTSTLLKSYVLATSGAVTAALSLNHLIASSATLSKGRHLPRFVPITAIGIGNCINIPLMRSSELANGILVKDANGKEVGKSKDAAKQAITKVVFSRIAMAVPSLVLPFYILEPFEKPGRLLHKHPALRPVGMTLIAGACLSFATPFACAIFPQEDSMKTKGTDLDGCGTDVVYFNKGL
jgi:tricarboxylate carrier